MWRAAIWAVLVCGLVVPGGLADDPNRVYPTAHQSPGTLPELQPGAQPEAPQPRSVPPKMPPPKTPDAPTPNPLADRLANPFAQPTEAGGQAARTFNENFDGDLGGVTYARRVTTGTTTVPVVTGFTETVVLDRLQNKTVIRTPIVVNQTVPVTQVVRVPVGTRYAGILVSENDSPTPGNRLYFGYNYYDRLNPSLNPGVGPTNMNREMIGFERAILDGDMSVGMRLPFVQQYGPLGTGVQAVGDLTLHSKFAFIRNPDTGDLISAGLYLTTPTGGGHPLLVDGTTVPRSWLLQPWAGFVSIYERGYVQGVAGMVIPTDNRDPTITNYSLAAGYVAYRGPAEGFLTAVVPTAEVHVHVPLDKRDPNGAVYFQDQVNVTAGVHFRTARATFSPAVCVPMVGPRPFAVEAMGFLNYRY